MVSPDEAEAHGQVALNGGRADSHDAGGQLWASFELISNKFLLQFEDAPLTGFVLGFHDDFLDTKATFIDVEVSCAKRRDVRIRVDSDPKDAPGTPYLFRNVVGELRPFKNDQSTADTHRLMALRFKPLCQGTFLAWVSLGKHFIGRFGYFAQCFHRQTMTLSSGVTDGASVERNQSKHSRTSPLDRRQGFVGDVRTPILRLATAPGLRESISGLDAAVPELGALEAGRFPKFKITKDRPLRSNMPSTDPPQHACTLANAIIPAHAPAMGVARVRAAAEGRRVRVVEGPVPLPSSSKRAHSTALVASPSASISKFIT